MNHSRYMRLQQLLFVVLCYLASCALAEKVLVTNESPQFCSGMYSKQDWNGDIKPFIDVDLKYFRSEFDFDIKKPSLSVVIYEYSDMDALGVELSDKPMQYICSEELVAAGLCESSELHQFIVNKNVTPEAEILSSVLTSYGNNGLRYKVLKTGYYCVACSSPRNLGDYENMFGVQANFQNSFGNLPAAEIPKLKVHGWLAILYAVGLSVYLFQLSAHKSELLLLQKYIAGIFVLLTVESIFVWSLLAFLNNDRTSTLHPPSENIKLYKLCASLLNALEMTSVPLLLVNIACGVDIVYPVLESEHEWIILVSFLVACFSNIIFGIPFFMISWFNTVSQPLQGPAGDDNNKDTEMPLWVTGIPCVIGFLVCYCLTLSTLQKTKKKLAEGKQSAKFNLYQRLFWLLSLFALLLISAILITIMLKTNNLLTEFRNLGRLFDFWWSYIFFVMFAGVAFLFRPSHKLYLLSGDNEFSEDLNAVPGGNDIEFDDLARLESTRLVGSFSNSFDDLLEFDLTGDAHKNHHAQRLSPPPSYGEHHDDESENWHSSS
ncbi:unnamed protein product [Kuraishia capsulata CBS 1993]|uniref:Uncharacterized protein n=1 Tax=Kuraishia capsulata CBS 1993 TaxID=1382522 RepID=W6MN68_9ASCO|nr:uncharacterized protein KUCA_T00004011001 [Kuraishia capsulata CBS 1993]CDK28031.1 unnamed protein product [Kuraishia capsulata CBS 1993]